ncbi:hypothetical protein WA158_002397 [Blastocystis sp. Blastoise]
MEDISEKDGSRSKLKLSFVGFERDQKFVILKSHLDKYKKSKLYSIVDNNDSYDEKNGWYLVENPQKYLYLVFETIKGHESILSEIPLEDQLEVTRAYLSCGITMPWQIDSHFRILREQKKKEDDINGYLKSLIKTVNSIEANVHNCYKRIEQLEDNLTEETKSIKENMKNISDELYTSICDTRTEVIGRILSLQEEVRVQFKAQNDTLLENRQSIIDFQQSSTNKIYDLHHVADTKLDSIQDGINKCNQNVQSSLKQESDNFNKLKKNVETMKNDVCKNQDSSFGSLKDQITSFKTLFEKKHRDTMNKSDDIHMKIGDCTRILSEEHKQIVSLIESESSNHHKDTTEFQESFMSRCSVSDDIMKKVQKSVKTVYVSQNNLLDRLLNGLTPIIDTTELLTFNILNNININKPFLYHINFMESTILSLYDRLWLTTKFKQDKQWVLAYRGTTHSFSVECMKSLCYHKECIIVVKTTGKEDNDEYPVFGGYTSVGWGSPHRYIINPPREGMGYCIDKDAFLFSLQNPHGYSNSLLPIQIKNCHYALLTGDPLVPISFSGGIYIQDIDGIMNKGYIDFFNKNLVYTSPCTDLGNSFFTNTASSNEKNSFDILEIEIYLDTQYSDFLKNSICSHVSMPV